MFLSTLGLKSDWMITEMVRAQRQSYDGAIAPVEDRRGSHLPSNKCDAEVIRLHINSYNPAISHYKRKNAPYKRYLNPELSIKEMYKNFSENKENNKICYKTYCNVFKSENIGFSRPSQDECEICLSYKDHQRFWSRLLLMRRMHRLCQTQSKVYSSPHWTLKAHPRGSCLSYRWYAKSYCTP